MTERDRGRIWALPMVGLALSCLVVPLHVMAVLVVGPLAFVLGRRRVRTSLLRGVAGAFLAVGCGAALLIGVQTPLVLVNGSAGALALALTYTLGRHVDDRRRYRETGWRLAQALDSRQRAVDAEARAAERARIAAEMHDSLGHDMALIAMRASALESKTSAASEDAPPRAEITELRVAASEATERLYEIVVLLRANEPQLPSELSEESLNELIAEAESAGMVIHHEIDPTYCLPAEPRHALCRRTVHRLVKESLTNATKHAPGAAVNVSVQRHGDTVHLRVRNPLGASSEYGAGSGVGHSGGRGLRTLAERVRVLGGDLEWHALDGHFEVVASVPVAATPSVPTDGEAPDQDLEPDVHRTETLRRGRRSLWTLALAPTAVLVGVLLLVAVVFTFTTVASVLPDDQFAQIHPGQSQTDAEQLLPLVEMHDAPAAHEPTKDCRYYEESVSFFERVDVFQVCFTGSVVDHTATIPAEQDRQ